MKIQIQGMAEKYKMDLQCQLNWLLSRVDPIFEKGNLRNCSCHRYDKHLEHEMNVVEKVLENRLHRIVTVNEMQFGFMPGRNN